MNERIQETQRVYSIEVLSLFSAIIDATRRCIGCFSPDYHAKQNTKGLELVPAPKGEGKWKIEASLKFSSVACGYACRSRGPSSGEVEKMGSKGQGKRENAEGEGSRSGLWQGSSPCGFHGHMPFRTFAMLPSSE